MRINYKNHGMGFCLIVMSLLSTSVFAQNPFLDDSASGSSYSNEEIRRLQSEMSNLRRDLDTMFINEGGNAKKPPGDASLDSTLNSDIEKSLLGSSGDIESYFEVNGVYIIKKGSSDDFGYMEVSPNTFQKLMKKENAGSQAVNPDSGVNTNAK